MELIPGDVVDHERTGRTTVVTASHCSKTLLAGGVPDLEFYLLTTYLYDPAHTPTHARLMALFQGLPR